MDGEAEGGVGEDPVLLKRAGTAAIATQTGIGSVKAEPSVTWNREITLMRCEEKIQSGVRKRTDRHHRTAGIRRLQAVVKSLESHSLATTAG